MEFSKTRRSSLAIENVMSKVYSWMILGLIISAYIGFTVANNEALFQQVQDKILLIIIAKLVMVFFIHKIARSLGNFAAGVIFMLYAASTGAFLSLLTLTYTSASMVNAFLTAAGLFGLMSLYGFTTKRNLETIGQYCFFVVVGLIVAIFVNYFMGSSTIDFIISIVGVLAFLGLTAFETQEIKSEPYYQRYPVLGALALYLNLINLFIFLVHLFGSSDD